jgi:hypothetical protein
MSVASTEAGPSNPHRLAELRASAVAPARHGAPAQAVAVVYATCALLALAYPQAIVAWLDDFEPNPVVSIAQGCAARLVDVSEGLGLAQISGRIRETGRRLTRKAD